MTDLTPLLQQCAPNVAVSTMHAIIRAESGFDPLALHVNGNVRLRRPPRTAAEAAAWSGWLIGQGYSVDMGLMQINSRNLARLNLTPAAVFDPCRNVRAGAAILTAQYGLAAQTHGAGPHALLRAISAYNTGSFDAGFRNGYVARVMRAGNAGPVPVLDPARLLARPFPPVTHPGPPVRPDAADSAIDGFGAAQVSAPVRRE
jgi:type IV secretion system protein VirB1